MADVVSLRLPAHLLSWATEYAKSRGVSRTDLLVEGLESFKEDCDRGVPEIRARSRRQAEGHGACSKNGAGHVWASARIDPQRHCVYCGAPGRGDAAKGEGGNLASAAADRAVFFSRLAPPMQNGTGKVLGDAKAR